MTSPSKPSLGFSPFFLDQFVQNPQSFPQSRTLEEIREEIQLNMYRATQGYRKGVWLVPISPYGFKSRIVVLKDGDQLEGRFQARANGEDPRKQTFFRVKSREDLPDAVRVDAVIYHSSVLEENDEPRTGCEWDLVTVLGYPTTERSPMGVGTLLANHFGASGGTSTLMNPEEFVVALKESVDYWSNKATASILEE